ncbi:hypothetical protein H6G73_11550 [Richelia sinica FACHB-800]|nr:hypothetical protein [Richelia sinica]MBD2665097.1 hypothetical protein [Richelia sinica FACHB-800]
MSPRLTLFFILTISFFVSAGVGVWIHQLQPMTLNTEVVNQQRQEFSVVAQSSEAIADPERHHYKTIPLDSNNFVLQGSDPTILALNAIDDLGLVSGKPEIEVVYPQPNQALVTVTQIPLTGNKGKKVKYRLEMTTFGRSLLVNSPPVWQIIWAGSQAKCLPTGKITSQYNGCQ